ncbi:hypothetical protein F2P45_19495 [Massilia sp. CCM 8733]|uniref:Uncharacterized protein n=1 Tax=Massilia mucilaginosa TaxID=2609282 RepID=A0ABX0NXQ7_9BURK|nr:hypothetical protein [Massilia mucilaginosa]NHZ91182.1 hypothetical protein [Massilia mucilaginosa]
MSIKSIGAITACMAYLGLRIDQHVHDPVDCYFSKKGGSSGLMEVAFHNDVHGHQGPYLVFDETIRGFGIRFQEFKPAYQSFEFLEGSDRGVLTCTGDDYEFTMKFTANSA